MLGQEIVIIDYGMGNINSIKKRLTKLGIDPKISADENEIKKADKLILPGIGHFSQAMQRLNELNLVEILNEEVLVKKKPILGICLGMQLMAKYSEEGNVNGLGWFDADIVKFNIKDTFKYKVPHVGWNQVQINKKSVIMDGITDLSEFYFVHSYFCKCKSEADVLNYSDHESIFASAIEKENIFGVQYHPEKSHSVGEKLIKNFCAI
jgi:imidazole glycerol-phosphate synthase subunit HisH